MELSIILVNWNSTDYLRSCLASVYRNLHGVRFEVVVVENASADGCESMLRREFPQVKLIVATHNLGFARANNLGYAQASGEILLFLNPDTEVIGDAIQCMVRWLKVHPRVGAAGARLLNSDGSLQSSCVQAFPNLLNQLLDSELLRRWFPRSRLWGCMSLMHAQRGAAEVDAISGACFMVRRSVFETAGSFTDAYFMYCDDLDLSYKIRQAGYDVVCLTHCEVVHHGGKSSSRQGTWFADIYRRRAMAQFFRQHRGPLYCTTYRVLMSVAALLRIGLLRAAITFAPWETRRQRLLCSCERWKKVLLWTVGIEDAAGKDSIQSVT